MSFNSSWVPDEDPRTLFSERCWLQGVVVSAIAYGITVCLYFLSFHLLVRKSNRLEFKTRLLLLIYITVSFLLGTLFMSALAAFTQMAFIDYRNYPGGPNAFMNIEFSIPLGRWGCATFVLSNWLSDALMVWRFKVIYQMCRVPLWIVMLFPCLVLAGSVVLGIMSVIQVSTTSPYVTNSTNFILVYYSLSLALNIILTIAIVLRLLALRHRIASVVGPAYGRHYTSIAAMVIESTALYSTVSITFLVLLGIGSPASRALIQSLNQFQTISTLLIVFRVARGEAWTKGTAACVTTGRGLGPLDLSKIQFALPNTFPALANSVETVVNVDGGLQEFSDASRDFSAAGDAA